MKTVLNVVISIVALLLIGCVNGSDNVVQVTADNMDSFMSKQPLLIEFYAPWCKHCQLFEPAYQSIADIVTKDGVSVGRVDIVENQAVAARFDIDSIPSFFLQRDNKIWKFTGPSTLDGILKFVNEGYKTTEPMPFWSSPIGPIGVSKGFLITLGARLMSLLPFLSEKLGIPQWAGFVLVAVGFGGIIMFTTLVGVYLSVKHAKLD